MKRQAVKFFRYSDHYGRGGLKEGARTYWRTRVVAYRPTQFPARVSAVAGFWVSEPLRGDKA